MWIQRHIRPCQPRQRVGSSPALSVSTVLAAGYGRSLMPRCSVKSLTRVPDSRFPRFRANSGESPRQEVGRRASHVASVGRVSGAILAGGRKPLLPAESSRGRPGPEKGAEKTGTETARSSPGLRDFSCGRRHRDRLSVWDRRSGRPETGTDFVSRQQAAML